MTTIVILPADYFESKKLCSQIANSEFKTRDELRKLLRNEMGIDYDAETISIMSLPEFVQGVNEQYFDVLSDSFITYVTILQ